MICPTQCYSSGTYSFGLGLEKCRVYNLFINGCNSDVCNVQLSATGPIGPCNLEIYEFINYDNDHNLEACVGVEKDFLLHQDQQDKFEWTIDGVVVGDDKHKIKHKFLQAGNFEICVSVSRLSAGGIRYEHQIKSVQ
ncbi:MAG: hypothetical protein IPI30_07630 [Saprospiraceae bacterium]|nr:hypothetical protein [Candidatus Vicinibacter affinis]